MPNLSQIKRQRMMDFLAQIKEEHKDDDAMLIALGEIESELNAKKYGLVWEEHEEAVDVKMQTHIPVFTEDASKEIICDTGGINLNAVFDTKVSVNILARQNGKATVFRFSSGCSVWPVRWSPAGGLNCRRSACHKTEPSFLCPYGIIEKCGGKLKGVRNN